MSSLRLVDTRPVLHTRMLQDRMAAETLKSDLRDIVNHAHVWCDRRRLNPRPRLSVRERGKGQNTSIPSVLHTMHWIEVI